jgi:FAD/FMN-containing dehydrogenase
MSTSGEQVLELLRRILPAERLQPPATTSLERPLAAPASEDEAVEILQLARSEGWSVLPIGRGSKLEWLRPPSRIDLLLSSRNLSGVSAYEPADGTVTARAGTPWNELVACTHERHHLSPEIPRSDRATLGGTLAAGASGLDRLRYGPVRHQVLGLAALHADGTRVKSGGRVVKNVTGYDLHRLWCGSEGSLCFLTEATLRLYPAPERSVVLSGRCRDLEQALGRCHALLRSGVSPLALVLTSRGQDQTLAVVLAGRSEAVEGECASAKAVLGAVACLEGAAALEARSALRELECAAGRWSPLVVTTRPSRLQPALAVLEQQARRLHLELELVLHPLLACAWVEFQGLALEDPRLLEFASALESSGLATRWRGLGPRTPPLRVDDTARELMRRIKQALDPAGLFAGGPP